MDNEIFIPQPFADELLIVAEESGITVSELVTEALKRYIRKEDAIE